VVNDIYLDDGTNTSNGTVGWLRLASTGPNVWVDVSVDTASVYLDSTNLFTREQTITIADTTNEEALTINQNDTTNNPDAFLLNNTGTGNSLNVNSGEFLIEGDGTLSVGAALSYETLVTGDDDIPNKKYVDDAITSASHTQNTDTGTTNNTFTVDSDASDGKLILDVTNGGTDNAITITNSVTTADRTITLPDATGTVALTSDLHTQNTDTGTTGNTFTVDSDSATGKIIIDVALGATDNSLTLTNAALDGDRTITFPNATGTLPLLESANTFSAEQTITIADTTNTEALTINQNDTTNNPSALLINNTGTGDVINVNTGEFRIEGDGTLSVGAALNYETLVTADDDIPNKKYVDDSISTAVAAVDTLDEVAHNGSSITIADTENLSITINQNDTTNNPSALVISNTGSGSSLAVNTNEFLIEGDGTLSVAGVTNYETLVTADDDIPNKKYVDDAITSGTHTQNTDTGTTNNTFTVDSDSSDGKLILDVTNGGTDNSVTLTNSVTTGDITITLPDSSGTVALTSDLHTQGTDTGTTNNSFTVDSDNATGKIAVQVATGGTDNSLTLTNTVTTADRTITFPDATGTVALTSDITNMVEFDPETASRDIYVECTSGNDTTGDGTSGSPYQTLGKAVDEIKDYLGGFNVTIHLAEAGTYVQADLYTKLSRIHSRGTIKFSADAAVRWAAADDSGNFENETYFTKEDTDKAWTIDEYKGFFCLDIDRSKYLAIAGNTATKLYIRGNGSFAAETIDNYSIHELACTIDANSSPSNMNCNLSFEYVNIPLEGSIGGSQSYNQESRILLEYCYISGLAFLLNQADYYYCAIEATTTAASVHRFGALNACAIRSNRPISSKHYMGALCVVSHDGTKRSCGAFNVNTYDTSWGELRLYDTFVKGFTHAFGPDLTNYLYSSNYILGGAFYWENVDFIARVHNGMTIKEDPSFAVYELSVGDLNTAEVTDNGTTEATYYKSIDDNYDASLLAPTDKVAVKQGLAENTDVDSAATETVDSFPDTVNASCVTWHYNVIDNDTAANRKSGTINAVWNAAGDTIDYNEFGIVEVGDASDVTLAVDIDTNTVRLRATTTSDNWTVRVKRILV
jgi:uncharacterized beta-barrel protein YwiB (DUF1934 family)